MEQPSPSPARRRYAFGPFIADCRKRLLWKDGAVVPLTPKAFEILAVLIDGRGRLVDKDELLRRVWGDVAVEDATLARHISTLRRALDEQPKQHLYVVTVPGRGYEFVAGVSEAEEPAAAPTPVRLAETEQPAAPPTPRRASAAASPSVILAAAFAFGIAIAVLYVFEFRSAQNHMTQRGLRQFTFRGGLQREAAWSPDGQWVAYTSDAAGSSDIWIQRISDAQTARVSSSPAEDSQPSWSPDSQRLAFRSERDGGGIYIVGARGGPERRIAEFGYRPKWSPDGTLVLFASSGHFGGSTRIYLVGADGGTPRLLRPDVLSAVTIADAEWKPDGTGVSIWGRAGGGWTFLTVPIDRGAPVVSSRDAALNRQIAGGQLTLGRFVWAPSRRYLFFEGLSEQVRNLWRVAVEPATGTWLSAERLTTGAGPDGDVTVSPDGMRLMFTARSARTRLWAYPFDALASRILGSAEPVTSGGGSEQDAESPADGTKLVYSATRGGRQEFWERSLADGRERLLLSSTGWNLTRPRWSRDGQQLAYFRRRATPAASQADFAVMVLPINGRERLLTPPGQVDMVPSDWSADGAWLLGSCRTGAPPRLGACVLPVFDNVVTASAMRVIASDPVKNIFESRFSPNQRWIAFVAVDRADARVSRIQIVPAAGGGWRSITDGLWYDDKPHWSPDGRTIYFLSDRSGMFNLWARRFDPDLGVSVGEPFQITTFASPRQTISAELSRNQIAVTPTHLFLPITESAGELWILDAVDR